jgi:hypothetical protein
VTAKEEAVGKSVNCQEKFATVHLPSVISPQKANFMSNVPNA